MRCNICYSTKVRKASDGFFCKNGHQLNIQIEESDFDPSLMSRKHTAKRIRKTVYTDEEIKTLRDRRNALLKKQRKLPKHIIYQIFQYTLKYQTVSFINALKLPKEIEHIVLDLWSMLANKMNFKFIHQKPNPFRSSRSASMVSSYYSDTASQTSASSANTGYTDMIIDEQGDEITDFDDDSDDDGVSTTGSTRSKVDREELYIFGNDLRIPTRKSVCKSIFPAYSLSLIYFACSWLRIPFVPADIWRLAGSGVIPYLSAFTHIPQYLLNELDAKKARMFQSGRTKSETLPAFLKFQQYTFALSGFYQSEYGLQVPNIDVNAPLMRLRLVVELGVPSEFYILSKILSEMNHGFSSPSPQIQNQHNKKPSPLKLADLSYTHIAATFVCCFKMIYGMDGNKRFDIESFPFLSGIPSLDVIMERLISQRKYLVGFGRWSFCEVDLADPESIKRYLKYIDKEILPKDAKNEALQNAYPKTQSIPQPPSSSSLPKPKSELNIDEDENPPPALGSQYAIYPCITNLSNTYDKHNGEYPYELSVLMMYLAEFGGIEVSLLEKVLESVENECRDFYSIA